MTDLSTVLLQWRWPIAEPDPVLILISTMLKELCCCAGVKTGDVFLSQVLDLQGSAAEIFLGPVY